MFAGPPTINFISNPQLTVEGNKTSLTCNATNDEDAVDSLQILWYKTKDNVTITGQQNEAEKSKITNIITVLQSTISFDPISHNDDGEYTCRSFNHPQSYDESKTKLSVECKERPISTICVQFCGCISMWLSIGGLEPLYFNFKRSFRN